MWLSHKLGEVVPNNYEIKLKKINECRPLYVWPQQKKYNIIIIKK